MYNIFFYILALVNINKNIYVQMVHYCIFQIKLIAQFSPYFFQRKLFNFQKIFIQFDKTLVNHKTVCNIQYNNFYPCQKREKYKATF